MAGPFALPPPAPDVRLRHRASLVLGASASLLVIAGLASTMVGWTDAQQDRLTVHLPGVLQTAIWQSQTVEGSSAATATSTMPAPTVAQIRALVARGDLRSVDEALSTLAERDAPLRAYVVAQAIVAGAQRESAAMPATTQYALQHQLDVLRSGPHRFIWPRTLARLESAAYGHAWSPIARDFIDRERRRRNLALFVAQGLACAGFALMSIGVALLAWYQRANHRVASARQSALGH